MWVQPAAAAWVYNSFPFTKSECNLNIHPSICEISFSHWAFSSSSSLPLYSSITYSSSFLPSSLPLISGHGFLILVCDQPVVNLLLWVLMVGYGCKLAVIGRGKYFVWKTKIFCYLMFYSNVYISVSACVISKFGMRLYMIQWYVCMFMSGWHFDQSNPCVYTASDA